MSGKNFGKLMMMRDSAKENKTPHTQHDYDYRDMRDYGDIPSDGRRYPDTARRTAKTERSRMTDQYDDDYDWPVERTERSP